MTTLVSPLRNSPPPAPPERSSLVHRLVARFGDLLLGPASRAGQIVADGEARIVGLVPGMPHVRPALRLVHSAVSPRMRHGLGPIVNHARAMSRG